MAQSVCRDDHDGRFVDRGHRHGGAARHAGTTQFTARVDFLKDEVFEICGALALGESLLIRLGLHNEAAHLATIFNVVEGRLVEMLPLYDGVAPDSCS